MHSNSYNIDLFVVKNIFKCEHLCNDDTANQSSYGCDSGKFSQEDDILHDEYTTTVKEIRETGRSLIPRYKQRAKISRMLWNSLATNGIYIHADLKGNIKYKEYFTLHSRFPLDSYSKHLFIMDRLKMPDNFFYYIWTNRNKKIRIKHYDSKEKKKLNKKQRKHERIKSKNSKEFPMDEDNTLIIKDPINNDTSIIKEEISDDEYNDSEEDKDSEYDDFKDVYHPKNYKSNYRYNPQKCKYEKTKKLSRKFSYLFSDAYICSKHSKKQNENIKCFLSDIVCTPLVKPEVNNYAKIINYESGEEEDYSCNITFGNFFTSKILAQLNLDGTFEPIESFESKHSKTLKLTANDVLFEEKSQNKCENEPPETLPTVKTDSSVDHTEKLRIIETKKDDRDKKIHGTQGMNAMVILSRSFLRPDNLSSEFKENYQEALCKNRRFVINIRNLAYQHVVRLQLLPLDIISQSDINMYLVFVYVTGADTDKDKYRVWINSTLPLSKPQEMFHELITKELTSIHELIHKAMDALYNPEVIKCLIDSKKAKKESMSKLPTCTFHLLWSTRLKIRITDFHNSDPDTEMIIRGKNFSIQNHGVHKGPAQSSICGICLQELNMNSIFPIALTVCSHWFCEECWKLKLCAQIKNKEQEGIVCIERGCTSKVDHTTLLSILNLKMILKFYNRNNIVHMFREQSNIISCPNSLCKKSIFSQNQTSVLQASKPDQFMPVVCSCHWQYCSKCLERPHWPVSCDISKIYRRCLEAQNLDNFSRVVKDEELPDLLLRGKSCPKCGTFIQEKNNLSKLEQCVCGCLFCWPCGKHVDKEMKDAHSFCKEQFELSNRALKAKMMKRSADDKAEMQISRWFKVALTHRQMRHPQVVRSLYEIADQIASRTRTVSESGRYIGDVKAAAVGWKSSLRKWNKIMYNRLKKKGSSHENNYDNITIRESPSSSEYGSSVVINNCTDQQGIENNSKDDDSVKSLSSSLELYETDSNIEFPITKMEGDSLIVKAVSNIVQFKLEIHHIIEHTAVMLEFDHSLNKYGNCGKIIRCMERAEDLCEGLGLLLQDPHNENIPRIIPTFLRLRLQAINNLSKLYHNLKLMNY